MTFAGDYAKRIKNARTNSKLNQEQFAQKLNEKPSLLRRIESGKVEPTIKLAEKIEKQAVEEGMITLHSSALLKLESGSTTVQEVIRETMVM